MLHARFFAPVLALSMLVATTASAQQAPRGGSNGWRSASSGKPLTGSEGSVRVGRLDVFYGKKVTAVLPSRNGNVTQQTTSRTIGVFSGVKANTSDTANLTAKKGVGMSSWKSRFLGVSRTAPVVQSGTLKMFGTKAQAKRTSGF